MSYRLKILYLRESGHDLKDIHNLFETEKIQYTLNLTENKEDFIREFQLGNNDIIIAEQANPALRNFEAVDLIRRTDLEIPFIILSDESDERLLIEAFKHRATDYLLKHQKSRLIPSIRRALLDARERAKRIQEEKTRQKYDFIINASRSMFTLVNRNYRYEAVNDTFCKAHNLVREEIIGKTLSDLWGEEVFQNYIKQNCDESFSDHVVRYQAWFKIPRLGLRCFEVAFYPYKEQGTDVTHTVVDTLDITDRQKIEDALKDSEARYRLLFDHANEAIILQKGNKITTCNTKTKEYFKYSKTELLNRSVYDLLPKYQANGSRSENKLKEIIEKKSEDLPFEFRCSFLRSDQTGFEADVSLASFQIRDEKYFQFFIHDITDKIKAEETRQMLVRAMEQSSELIVITGIHGTFEYANPVFVEKTGYSLQEIIEQGWKVLADQDFYQNHREKIANTLIKQQNWTGEITIRTRNNDILKVLTSISPIRNQAGEISNFVVVMRDITEDSKIQNYLRRVQKMETIGTLAGGIAHDFNNILATIIGHTDLAIEEIGKKHSSFHDLEQIKKASNRAKELIDQILTFSKQVELKAREVIFPKLINEAIELIQPQVAQNINIQLDLNRECPPLLADPSHMHQVIMNICTNALYAMRLKGGTLTIKLDCLNVDASFQKQFPNLKRTKHIKLTFEDTGTGMEPQVIERIFEPFYTTKPVGKGTGLGLSVVHGIIKSMEGEILVESKPGEGSVFTILLPVEPENFNTL